MSALSLPRSLRIPFALIVAALSTSLLSAPARAQQFRFDGTPQVTGTVWDSNGSLYFALINLSARNNTTSTRTMIASAPDCGVFQGETDRYDQWGDPNGTVLNACFTNPGVVTAGAGATATVTLHVPLFPRLDGNLKLLLGDQSMTWTDSVAIHIVTDQSASLVNASIVPFQPPVVTFTPHVARLSGTTLPPNSAPAQVLTISNGGNAAATYAVGVSCSGSLTACTIAGTGSASGSYTLGAGASGIVSVAFQTGTPGTSGQVRVVMTAPPRPSSGLVEADTSSFTVTAGDPPPPTITISPSSAPNPDTGEPTVASVSSHVQTVTVDVCGTGSIGTPTLDAGGATLSPSNVSAPPACPGKRATFSVTFPVGNSRLVATASDAYHTVSATQDYFYDDWRDHKPVVAAVHPSTQINAATTSADTFTVTNNGWRTVSYSLWGQCGTSNYAACTTTPSSLSVTVAPGASVRVPVTVWTESYARGSTATITLTATYSGPASPVSSSASMSAAVTAAGIAPTIAVTPASGTVFNTSVIDQVRIDWCDADDFIVDRTITWRGQVVTAGMTATQRSGCLMAAYSILSNLSLATGQQDLVITARDYVGHVTTVTTTFGYQPQLSSFRPRVRPTAHWHRIPAQSNVAAADTFTVSNTGSFVASYSLAPRCSVGLSVCNVAPGSVSLSPGSSATAIVSYAHVGGTDVTDTVRLAATYVAPLGGSIADTGTKVVVAPSLEASPVVSTSGGLGSIWAGYVSSVFYTLVNPSSTPVTVTLTAAATNGFQINDFIGSDQPGQWTLTLAPSTPMTFAVNVRAPGTNGVSGVATLTASYLSTAGQTLRGGATALLVSGAPPSPTPVASVSVDPKSETRVLPPNRAKTLKFSVAASSGAASTTVNLTASCPNTAAVVCGVPQPATVNVADGQPAEVTVGVVAGAAGQTGTVRLIATVAGGLIADTGSFVLTTAAANGPITVSAPSRLNAESSIERDECLTISAGSNAAYECGDLRIVHPLPATTTMNTTRAPALIYTSAHAAPVARIAVDVSVDETICPAQISATVRFGAVVTTPRLYTWNGPCGQAATRRIVISVDARALTLASGANPYIVEVRAASDQSIRAADSSGVLAVVDRSGSRFGPGWWLDGLEQLLVVPGHADQLFWIGGDGSTRLFRQITADTFTVAQAVDRPERLVKVGGGYRRLLRNGAYVRFDGLLRHVETVDASGHSTRFVWNDQVATQLDNIVLAVPDTTNPAAHRTYTFSYINGLLSTVTAPPGPSGARLTILTRSAGDLAITDPGSAAVHYTLDASNRITARINRLSDATRFEIDPTTGLVLSSTIDMTRTGGQSIRTAFCPAEGASLLACAAILTDPTKTRTLLDGPRTDVSDTTAFYLNRFGAPSKIVNAGGAPTFVERSNLQYPALATATVQANGHRVEADYNDRGLVIEQRDVNAFDDGRVARTTYQWHRTFDKPEAIVGPSGETTRFGYFANGDRQWQEDGRGPMSRVWFTYNASRQLESVSTPGNLATQTDRIIYESLLGNVQTTITPRGFVTEHVRDVLGRVTLTLSPTDTLQTQSLKQQVRTVYNIRDLVDSTVSIGAAIPYSLHGGRAAYSAPVTADTLFTAHGYDAEGRVTTTSVTSSVSPNEVDVDRAHISVDESWLFDAAGRAVRHRKNNFANDSTVYDLAGNVVQHITASGGGYTQAFDSLNQIVSRAVAGRTYPAQRCESMLSGNLANPSSLGGCFIAFPAIPNSGSGYATPSDIALFSYDAMGRLLSAENRDAKVHRKYFVGGALHFDSTTYLSATGAGFGHPKGIELHYDLSGRRDVVKLPGGNSTAYGYRPDNGALSVVTDHQGNQYRYDYDSAGRVQLFTVGTAISEQRWYDADGNQYQRRRVLPALGKQTNEALTFDARGRVVVAAYDTPANAIPSSTTYLAYSGLGAVLARERVESLNWETEEFRVDGLGNVLQSKSSSSGDAGLPLVSQFFARGGLNKRGSAVNPDFPKQVDSLFQTFDLDGHTASSHHLVRDKTGLVELMDSPTRSYYGADGKLRAIERYNGASSVASGTWEEYRYDALGRRVMVIAQPGIRPPGCGANQCAPLCTVGNCASSVTWTMYDGAQIVQEERRSYPDGDINPPNNGIVEYIHGPDLDKPLAVNDWNSGIRILNPNWRGLFESSVTPSGQAADQSLLSSSSVRLAWPEGHAVYSRPKPRENVALPPITWMGSLVSDQQDGSGQLFRRNRYFDPDAGRFTQEDPIGFGGGSNLYGLAHGDPVNFSDPFGLCGPLTPICVWFLTNLPEITAFGAEALTGYSLSRGRLTGNALREAGRVGEAAVEANLVRQGYTILGRQVSARTSAGRRVIDFLAQRPDGTLTAIEAKAGSAVRKAAQVFKDEKMATEGAKLVGKNAPAALRDATLVVPTEVRRP